MGSEVAGIVKLKCSVKNYDWGKVGDESCVARLYVRNTGEPVEGDKPYAELWMGTHESGPSYVVEANGGLLSDDCKRKERDLLSLKDWIERNPSVLGEKVRQRWGSNLPFLFKVLSVAKALSIQAHPDKTLAEILHKELPEVYKDDNHKPEMALALTEFEALCGFVGLEELKTVVHNVPEIIEVVGSSYADQVLQISEDVEEEKLKEILKALFSKLMSASKDVVSEVIAKLISRLHLKSEVRELTDKEELILRLEKQYPGDIGLIAAFLLNQVKLKPGEALYLGANEPHAYIKGECMECMATSDNVVRAGLTPKDRDIKTLCSMLSYKQGFPEILPGVPSNPHTVKYVPPFDEFEVDQCNLPPATSTVFPAVPGPCILVVTKGEGRLRTPISNDPITEGDVLFSSANTEITVGTVSGVSLYRAGVNSRFFEKSEPSWKN